jgi:hypothetical protein
VPPPSPHASVPDSLSDHRILYSLTLFNRGTCPGAVLYHIVQYSGERDFCSRCIILTKHATACLSGQLFRFIRSSPGLHVLYCLRSTGTRNRSPSGSSCLQEPIFGTVTAQSFNSASCRLRRRLSPQRCMSKLYSTGPLLAVLLHTGIALELKTIMPH